MYVLLASWPNGPLQAPLDRLWAELHLSPFETAPVHCVQLTGLALLPWFQAKKVDGPL